MLHAQFSGGGSLVIRANGATPLYLGPVALEGAHVRLEPLRFHHLDDLLAVAQDQEIWTWLPENLSTREALERWVVEAIGMEEEGRAYAFAVISLATGRAIGS